MSKLVEFGTVSTQTKANFFQGKQLDGQKAPMGSFWYYKTTDSDMTQPLRPAPFG